MGPCDSVCKVVGVKLDLAKLSVALASNTPGGVEGFTLEIAAALEAGKLSRKDGVRFEGETSVCRCPVVRQILSPQFEGPWKTHSLWQESLVQDIVAALKLLNFVFAINQVRRWLLLHSAPYGVSVARSIRQW